jgi:hypothetical protein
MLLLWLRVKENIASNQLLQRLFYTVVFEVAPFIISLFVQECHTIKFYRVAH